MVAENFTPEEYNEGPESHQGTHGIHNNYRFRFQPTLPPIPEVEEDSLQTDESPQSSQTRLGF